MNFVPYRDRSHEARKPLDRDQIVAAALALVDESGLDALTMRRVAERLGVKAASLYRHVQNKEELMVLLADAISGEVALPDPALDWQEQLRRMAHSVRRNLLAHRDGAKLLAETMPWGPNRLGHIEATLGILRSAGLKGAAITRAAYYLNNFVNEFVADEARLATAASATGVSRQELIAMGRDYVRSLPADVYPLMIEHADVLFEDDPDALFEFGLELCLRGLEALAARDEPQGPASKAQS